MAYRSIARSAFSWGGDIVVVQSIPVSSGQLEILPLSHETEQPAVAINSIYINTYFEVHSFRPCGVLHTTYHAVHPEVLLVFLIVLLYTLLLRTVQVSWTGCSPVLLAFISRVYLTMSPSLSIHTYLRNEQ